MRALLVLLIGLAQVTLGFSKTVTAASGNATDVQSAINSAGTGDTVQIPAGTFNWANGVSVKKQIKLYGMGASTVINQNGSNTLVDLTAQPGGSVELAKIRFTRTPGQNGIFVVANGGGVPTLVHDCTFENVQFGSRCMEWRTNGGVIYDCNFVSSDKSDNSGIAFKNPSSDSAWHEVDVMGDKDANGDKNTYLEDCTFKDFFLQALDFDDNSRTVMRHCKFDNSAVASHGQETSAVGARQWELYECEFIFTNGGNSNPGKQEYPLNMNLFLFIRGGGPGVCWNNKIPDISSSAWGNKPEVKFNLYNIRRRGQVPCQTSYPAARQIGFGSDTQGRLVSSPVYFWGNTGAGNYANPALEDYNPDECGNGLHTADFVKKGRDFFVDTEKPGYKPYAYPHPLRAGGSGPTPTPNPTPTATPPPQPTPTPTPPPQPTPTPTPTPPTTETYRNWLDLLSRWIETHPAQPDQ
jgi:hypothetical protein